jgi:hypothetical protein
MTKLPDTNSKSWFARHKTLTIIGATIVVIIIASAAGGSKKPTTKTDTSASNNTANSKKADTATAKIGEPVSDGKFQFTVNSLKCNEASVSDSTGYLTKTAQGQYCELNITAKNTGNQAQTLDSMSQYLFNASNQKYSSDSAATITVNPSSSTFLNNINPGNSVTGVMVFDLPKGTTPVIAELHDSSLSGGVKVSLQ